MARLVAPDRAMLLGDYQLLISTHWIRVALITAYGITYFHMLIRSATTAQCEHFVSFQTLPTQQNLPQGTDACNSFR